MKKLKQIRYQKLNEPVKPSWADESPLTRLKWEVYKQLLTERVILLNWDITDELIELLVVPLIRMNKNGANKPITIMINSSGGSIDSMHAAIDAIQTSTAPVTTIALGKCMSAGLDIFLAGKRRLCQPNTLFMMHSGKSSVIEAPLPSIVSEGVFLKQLMKRWATYYASKTKKPQSYWYSLLKSGKDYVFFAEEAIKNGVANGYLGGVTRGR